MAGRRGITLSDVALACVRLKQQNRALGPRNVRLELGRGGMTTISRHLRYLALVDLCDRAFSTSEGNTGGTSGWKGRPR